MAKTKPKIYVVWAGRTPGIYTTWPEAEAQVKGFPGAKFKGFESRAEAEQAFRAAPAVYIGKATAPSPVQERLIVGPPPITQSVAVDAACAGVPGPVEYRGVNVETGAELFRFGPYRDGTNNIGEFLAIVQALMLLSERDDSATPIYSDSLNALGWVAQKKCKTNQPRSTANAELFRRVDRAELWLRENDYDNPVLKWDTEAWGENPADFGRK